jgi:hypothetical protein
MWITLFLLGVIGAAVLRGYSLAAVLTGLGTAVIVAHEAARRISGVGTPSALSSPTSPAPPPERPAMDRPNEQVGEDQTDQRMTGRFGADEQDGADGSPESGEGR